MNIKNKVIFFLFLMFNLKAIAFKGVVKGEACIIEASPLYIQQKGDTILVNRYLKIKKSIKKNDYSNSLALGLKLLDDSKKKNDRDLEFLTTFMIGDLFIKLNDHNKSLEYLNISKNLLLRQDKYYFSEKNKTYGVVASKNKYLANIFLRLGSEYLAIKKKDSATYFFKELVNLNSLNDELLTVKASAYNNLSGIYIQDSLYDKAREFSLKVIEIRRKTKNKLFEASALGNLASIYAFEESYKKSKEIYLEAINLIENDKSSTAFRYKRDLYLNLAWALYNLKDYTAYNYQEKSYDIKDSLRSVNFEHVMQQIYEKHQVNLAKEKVNLAIAEERKTNYYLGGLALLILISSGVLLYNYKLRQNNLKLKLSQTQLAQKSKLEKLKSESQVRILNATLDGKETERKQIAETLHDSVSSLLSSANLHLQASKMQFNGNTPIEIDKTQKIIVEASQTIRDLSHTLVSSVLLKFGLKYAIKDMADKFSNSQITIETKIKNVRRYQQNFEIKVNNIIQEFVNNVLKHSNATRAIVKIEDKEGKLFIYIKDNGEGFDKQEAVKKDGLGINQIDARIQMMKGEFHIDSNAETGTKIDIVLPILEIEVTRV